MCSNCGPMAKRSRPRVHIFNVGLLKQTLRWCLQLPIAENEDTQSTISQNGFYFICLKTCCFSKITNNYLYIISNKYIFIATSL